MPARPGRVSDSSSMLVVVIRTKRKKGRRGEGIRAGGKRGLVSFSPISFSLILARDQKTWLAFRVKRRGATYELAMLRIRVVHWGKAPHFPRAKGKRDGWAERDGRKEKEGWSGPHPALSLPLLTHLSISLHQPAPCVSSSPVEKKSVRIWGPSIRRRPPRPSVAGPTNRPRPAERAPPGAKSNAADSGRDRSL